MVHYSERMAQQERNIKELEIAEHFMDASKETVEMVRAFTDDSVSYVYDGKDLSIPQVELGIRRMVDQCVQYFHDQGYLRKNKNRKLCSINIDRDNRSVMVSVYPRCAKRAFTFALSV